MKKVIALCLVLVLVVSVASLCFAGNMRCGRCGKYHAGVIDTYTSYTYVNGSTHKKTTSRQIYCPDCHSCYWESGSSSNEGHYNLSHHTQWLTPHLFYEYDTCGACGGKTNEKTTYVN